MMGAGSLSFGRLVSFLHHLPQRPGVLYGVAKGVVVEVSINGAPLDPRPDGHRFSCRRWIGNAGTHCTSLSRTLDARTQVVRSSSTHARAIRGFLPSLSDRARICTRRRNSAREYERAHLVHPSRSGSGMVRCAIQLASVTVNWLSVCVL